jgi:photosystem II stability/assembly factor-like uncharacterized protein
MLLKRIFQPSKQKTMIKHNTMNVKYPLLLIALLLLPSLFNTVRAQNPTPAELREAANGLALRGVGPALMGGRIADIAVDPFDRSTWYVAVGSGGVWKTTNSGITWCPIFDGQKSYSIGTVAIDPSQSNIVWVGTGENVSGRHVGWGDGIYKSRDGGATWQHMGLGRSEHIGKILVDPNNSDVVYVAAEGPLWSSGGERGLYKTMDGGATWSLVLELDADTGVTDVEFDPANPNVLYAAAYQRRRQTWSLLAGGPKSGIYKSTDQGATWRRMSNGLPSGDMGKIGLAVTPADASRVYATIEANDKEKGFYRSMDGGESWEKRNSYISGGTGPHYYQEIEVSPTNPDVVYQMDVFLNVTRDGGNTFTILGTGREKHSDNHALWIDPQNGDHLLAGTDGGLYESYDEGTTWRHFPNMPISQFYKLGLDNALPFYNIVGGAQDLGTLLGPSRTMNTEGIRNQDWYVPLGADGYDSTFDPEDANTAYIEIQEGLLHRLDRRTEEVLNIQPQPAAGDAPERWNWDSPVLISPHKSKRLYFGSQRLWKSEDRGDSWTPISQDLTTNTNRYTLETLDNRVWSIDALYDTGAMSKYATLTAIAESPKQEGLLYTGSDDGLLHVSGDGGATWRRAAALPKVPERSFINDIEASQHDAATVFVAADAHKFGNYSPMLFMSTDTGASWKSIAGDLPNNTIIWVIKQDYENEDLLFIGTEFGVYFSPNKGTHWIPLGSGVPTIPFRDLELHERDADLVGATFGRGFYILDDYTPLRHMKEVLAQKQNTLFPIRDAWWYMPSVPMQAKGMPGQGTTSFRTENPPFGALLTYYVQQVPKTAKEQRQETERTLRASGKSIPFPGFERLGEEERSQGPQILVLIANANGEPVRWIKGEAKKGLHRTHWDLRLPPPDPINLEVPAFRPPWAGEDVGPMAPPGTYSAQLYLLDKGALLPQGEPQAFEVKPVHDGETDYTAVADFQKSTSDLSREMAGVGRKLREVQDRLRHIKAALVQTPKAGSALFATYDALQNQLAKLKETLSGDAIRQQLNEPKDPSMQSRLGQVIYGHWETTQMPTATQRQQLNLAQSAFTSFKTEVNTYLEQLRTFEAQLRAAGAPYTPGRDWD